MTIPIIILNWNGLADTLECLASLEAQSYQDFVVYLVDNGSQGKNREILQQQFGRNERIQLIFNEENLGFTKGNNEILRQYILPNPAYKYVLLLNNDTVQDKNWIANLVNSAKLNEAQIVSSKMINYFDRSKMDNSGHQMLNTGEIIPVGFNEPIEAHTELVENLGACAGAALYDVEMLRKMGVLDEYFSTGYEDAEIGLRANVLGYKTIYEPSAIVYHKISQSVAKIWNYEYVLQIQVNIYYTFLKLMPLRIILLSLPSLLFKFFSLLIINLVFLRTKFLKILFHAYYRIFFKEWTTIKQQRALFFTNQQLIANGEIRKKLRFFLWFDIWRFYKYILLRKATTFEKW